MTTKNRRLALALLVALVLIPVLVILFTRVLGPATRDLSRAQRELSDTGITGVHFYVGTPKLPATPAPAASPVPVTPTPSPLPQTPAPTASPAPTPINSVRMIGEIVPPKNAFFPVDDLRAVVAQDDGTQGIIHPIRDLRISFTARPGSIHMVMVGRGGTGPDLANLDAMEVVTAPFDVEEYRFPILLEGDYEVTIKAESPTGQPVSSAVFAVMQNRDMDGAMMPRGVVQSIPTRMDGTAPIRLLEADVYTARLVSCDEPYWLPDSVNFTPSQLTEAGDVMKIVLAPKAIVWGQVVLEDGSPAEGTQVTLLRSDLSIYTEDGGNPASVSTTTDRDGFFEINLGTSLTGATPCVIAATRDENLFALTAAMVPSEEATTVKLLPACKRAVIADMSASETPSRWEIALPVATSGGPTWVNIELGSSFITVQQSADGEWTVGPVFRNAGTLTVTRGGIQDRYSSPDGPTGACRLRLTNRMVLQ